MGLQLDMVTVNLKFDGEDWADVERRILRMAKGLVPLPVLEQTAHIAESAGVPVDVMVGRILLDWWARHNTDGGKPCLHMVANNSENDESRYRGMLQWHRARRTCGRK